MCVTRIFESQESAHLYKSLYTWCVCARLCVRVSVVCVCLVLEGGTEASDGGGGVSVPMVCVCVCVCLGVQDGIKTAVLEFP